MGLELPSTLSPSKVSAFTHCALAFKYAVIDRLPEPPSVATVKGTLVHAALERLYLLAPAARTRAAALDCLDAAHRMLLADAEWLALAPTPAQEVALLDEAELLVTNLFRLEDPTTVQPIGLEVQVEADIAGARVRGIIDRLELDADGELVVTDYKTGRAPSERYETGKLVGIAVYSLLCERLLGRRPARIRLLHLAEPVELSTVPDDRSTGAIERKLGAVWSAIARACERDDFRPRPGRLCDYCAFRAQCPAFAAA